MLAIALETSSRSASVAVDAAGTRSETVLGHERAHASDLLPTLARMLDELGQTARRVDTVLVGTGPGSYTGLRVGIATALGLAHATGADLLGVPSGETLVQGEIEPGNDAVFLLDARQGELYFAHYRRSVDGVEVLRAPCVLRPAELADALPADVPILAGPGAADAAALDDDARARVIEGRAPRAGALLELGGVRLRERGPQAAETVEPLYLRPFAAKRRRR